MPSGTNSYAFCADYSDVAICLTAIEASHKAGQFDGDAEVLRLLHLFEYDVLKKLYLRSIRVLGILNGNVTDLLGDFEDADFSYMDFHVGYRYEGAEGYAATFKTILNIFREFCLRIAEISDADKFSIDSALLPVLDAFDKIKAHLIAVGLNPCQVTETKYQNNSLELCLLVAGSDGSNGIPEGLHLRWAFTAELGLNHLPKGTHNNTGGSGTGYNKPDDFVRIFRTPYLNPVRIEVDFENTRPLVDFESKTWTYSLNETIQDREISHRVRLIFTDAAEYDSLAVSLDPAVAYFQFLKDYQHVIELEVVNTPCFIAGFEFKNSTAAEATLKIEAISPSFDYASPEEDENEVIRTRKTLKVNAGVTQALSLMAENMNRIRFKKSTGSEVTGFHFETYSDFVRTRTELNWTEVGDGFSLSLDDQEVYTRLESSEYVVDHVWPQYNNGTTVKVQNYEEKWSVSTQDDESIKDVVIKYLDLSDTDPRAEEVLREDGAALTDPGILVSYLDVLNLQAGDYHIARMLGLGHIDVIPTAGDNDRFIYQLRYTNRASLEDPEETDYLYTSLPTSKIDTRLPEKPMIRPITYGLPVVDEQVNTGFDEDGYASWDYVRAINIGRQLFPDEDSELDFFSDFSVENFNIFERPRPVSFGVEYRSAAQSAYVKPEITQENIMGTVYFAYDTDFPVAGVPETVPVPDNETSLYIHLERRSGVHYYAIYGINLFSRASVLSDEVATDETQFPIVNTLLPPTELTAQYIQKEETLLFTTAREQGWLNGRMETFPGQDIGLTRITFNWLDVVDVSKYTNPTTEDLEDIVKPDKANVFFRTTLPKVVSGLISGVSPVEGSQTKLSLSVEGYQTIDGTMVLPSFSGGSDAFKNSILTTSDRQFKVLDVISGQIIIEAAVEPTNISSIDENEPQEGADFAVQNTFFAPEVGGKFTVVENLSNPGTWEELTEDIALISFADPEDPEIEIYTDEEGTQTKLWAGGITATGNVTPEPSMPNYFKISFGSSVVLPPHPQVNIPFDPLFPQKNAPGALHEAHVEWYKGLVRMPVAGVGEIKKVIEVQVISQGSTLDLYIYDPTFADHPFQTGNVVVNFHPGYRVYLFPEPSGSFNASGILPAGDETERKAMLGVQSADERPSGSGFVSFISLPAVLYARAYQEPMQLENPIVPNLKVRPDATGKASFTFDFPIPTTAGGMARTPFGFMFYRIDEEGDLMPLLEQVPMYSFVKEGRQTENDLPTIRDIDGNLLNPGDPRFNPFPMVRKYTANGKSYIRFTDYTLNWSSRSEYFYAATEVTNELVSGALSPLIGPVTILHTMPPDAPVVRSYIIQLPAGADDTISIRFLLAPISTAEEISKIRLYSTVDPLKAVDVKMMEREIEIEVDPQIFNGSDVVDTFEDMETIPFGKTMYYRMVGVRTIINEFDLPEDVFSYTSEITQVKLIDTKNPVAPTVSYSGALNKLSWMPTTFSGSYYLYKQNAKGNWEKIFTVLPPDTSEEMEYVLPAPLVPIDGDGNRIYYRFKVEVENSGGLFNLTDNVLTV